MRNERAALWFAWILGISAVCLWQCQEGNGPEPAARPVVDDAVIYGGAAATPTQVSFSFRGNNQRSGAIYELGLPSKSLALASRWRDPELNIHLHTASKATPAVDSSGIYLGADTGWFKKWDFNGNLAWSFFAKTRSRGIHGTAALSADTVFFGAYNGWFYALDKATGHPRWAAKLGMAIGASPLLIGSHIYVTVETESDGYVVKLNAGDGKHIWVSEFLGDQAHSSVTLDPDSGLLIVGSNARNIVALDQTTGEKRWSYATTGPNKNTGAMFGGKYISVSLDGNVVAIEGRTGQLGWAFHASGSSLSNVAVNLKRGIAVFATSLGIYGLDARSGAQVWHYIYPSDSVWNLLRQTAALVHSPGADGLFFQCAKNTLCLFDWAGKIVMRKSIRDAYSGSPTLFGGQLYLAYESQGLESFTIKRDQ